MTRKSKKGIVGKAMPSYSKRYKVGQGTELAGNIFISENKANSSMKASDR